MVLNIELLPGDSVCWWGTCVGCGSWDFAWLIGRCCDIWENGICDVSEGEGFDFCEVGLCLGEACENEVCGTCDICDSGTWDICKGGMCGICGRQNGGADDRDECAIQPRECGNGIFCHYCF